MLHACTRVVLATCVPCCSALRQGGGAAALLGCRCCCGAALHCRLARPQPGACAWHGRGRQRGANEPATPCVQRVGQQLASSRSPWGGQCEEQGCPGAAGAGVNAELCPCLHPLPALCRGPCRALGPNTLPGPHTHMPEIVGGLRKVLSHACMNAMGGGGQALSGRFPSGCRVPRSPAPVVPNL